MILSIIAAIGNNNELVDLGPDGASALAHLMNYHGNYLSPYPPEGLYA